MENFSKYNALAIIGATATGKTHLGVECAQRYDGEIISADSRQVYKELTLGSGKDLFEYGGTPYHLIDVCDLRGEYTVFNFQRDCVSAFEKILSNKRLPIIVGGTGLYLNAIFQSYQLIEVPIDEALRGQLSTYSQERLGSMLTELNPNLHNKTDLFIRERTIRAIEIAKYKAAHPEASHMENPIRPLIFKLHFERAVLRERIRQRLKQRIDAGMIDEVKGILEQFPQDRILRLGLEYKFTTQFLNGEFSFEEYFEKLVIAIYQFAKRQETWFRKMQRENIIMVELDGSDIEGAKQKIDEALYGNG